MKLQRLQNVAAKIIVGGSKYEHVTSILRELHWLPVESRIHFKIMVLVHRAANDTGPVYLQELATSMYRPGRSLRSQSAHPVETSVVFVLTLPLNAMRPFPPN